MNDKIFRITLNNKSDNTKHLSYCIYAPNQAYARRLTEIALGNIQKRNDNAKNYEIAGVEYEPEDQTVA